MCNPAVNFFFWEEDGEATRRQDAASGRGERRQDGASRRGEIATRRDPLQGGELTMLSWA
jgi:hypothetical protein